MADRMGGILTNGLGADCKALIIGPFRLNCIVQAAQGGGGSAVPPRWFQPLRSDRDEDEDDLRKVTFVFRITENRTITKEYIVTADRASKYVSIIGKINRAIENVTATWRRSVIGKFVRKIKAENIESKNEKD